MCEHAPTHDGVPGRLEFEEEQIAWTSAQNSPEPDGCQMFTSSTVGMTAARKLNQGLCVTPTKMRSMCMSIVSG